MRIRRRSASPRSESSPCAPRATRMRWMPRPARSASSTELRPYRRSIGNSPSGSALDAPGGFAAGLVLNDDAKLAEPVANLIGQGPLLHLPKLAPRLKQLANQQGQGRPFASDIALR